MFIKNFGTRQEQKIIVACFAAGSSRQSAMHTTIICRPEKIIATHISLITCATTAKYDNVPIVGRRTDILDYNVLGAFSYHKHTRAHNYSFCSSRLPPVHIIHTDKCIVCMSLCMRVVNVCIHVS